MSWNYRVMRRDGELAIYEVYYDEDGRVKGCSKDPAFPGGPNLEELRVNLEQYASALEEPVLDYEGETPEPHDRAPDRRDDDAVEAVWIFVGVGARFPSGVFADLAEAERWIARHGVSGVLTRYPVGLGAFDWAVGKGYFKPRPERVIDGRFVGRFSSAYMPHHHYEEGRRQGAAEDDAAP